MTHSLSRTRLSVAAALLFFFAAFAATLQPASAVNTSVARNVPYVAAFTPMFAMDIPFYGTMRLNFNNGIISGKYTDMSIRPGSPLDNRVDVPISGGVDGNNIHFTIGTVFSVNGTLQGDTISGSALYRGRMYQFLARQGTPHNQHG